MRSGLDRDSAPRALEWQPRGTAIDSAVAVGLALLAAYASFDPPGPAFAGPAGVVWLTSAALALPVAVRRRWPLPVLVWVVLAAGVATALGVVGTGVIWVSYIPVAVALYTAATAVRPVPGTAALAGSLAAAATTIPLLYETSGITTADATDSEAPLWWQVELGMTAVMITAAWAAGQVVRWRRIVRTEFAARLARDAVAAERLRIARELHDIIGHSMSLITVKATVANHIARERPAEAQAALGTIERTSRAALTEIRRLLDVLRSDAHPAAELSPSPGTADLPDLANQLRSAGLQIDLRIDGVDDLPQGVDLTVFRIVQEALTNVMKHANTDQCQVTVRAGASAIHIEVLDDGRALRPAGRRSGPGQGLIGIRERVTMYGGTLTTGPRSQGGFQVIAEIPYAASNEAA